MDIMSVSDYLSDDSDWLNLDCNKNCSGCEYREHYEECRGM